MAKTFDATYYTILDISLGASNREIKESYRRLALLRHPDKNPGDLTACARFQKLNEAYETLYDEIRRSKYDEELKRQYGRGLGSKTSPSEKEVQEQCRRFQEDKIYREKERESLGKIAELKKNVEMYEDLIKKAEKSERERIEKEKQQSQGWWAFLMGPSKPNEAQEEILRQERLQQNASRSIKLQWARNELRKCEVEREEMIRRHKIAKDRETKEKEQKMKETRERMAREEEVRRKEAASRAARERFEKEQKERQQREAAARQNEARQAEIKERDQRDLLRKKMEKQVLERERAEAERARAERARAEPPKPNQGPHQRAPNQQTPKKNRHANPPQPESRTSGRQKGPEQKFTICRNNSFWPRVDGRHQCTVCLQHFGTFVLKCPDCGKLACVSCKKRLGGHYKGVTRRYVDG